MIHSINQSDNKSLQQRAYQPTKCKSELCPGADW